MTCIYLFFIHCKLNTSYAVLSTHKSKRHNLKLFKNPPKNIVLAKSYLITNTASVQLKFN